MFQPESGLIPIGWGGAVSAVTGAVSLRKGTEGWMPSWMSRLPISTADISAVMEKRSEAAATSGVGAIGANPRSGTPKG